MRIRLAVFALLLSALACQGVSRKAEQPRPPAPQAQPAASAPLAPARLSLQALESPAGVGSHCPDLGVDGSGRAVLSWIQPGAGGVPSLLVSAHGAEGWTAPSTVVATPALLANWADTPRLGTLTDGGLAIAWPVRHPTEPHAYSLQLATAPAASGPWSEPVTAHDDDSAAEHGFPSFFRDGTGQAGIAWLDGRAYAAAGGDEDHPPPGVAMAVMARTLLPAGGLSAERVLDARACDCCPTAVTSVDGVAVLAYRDRSDEEVRDVSLVRLAQGTWSAPSTPSPDGWTVPGCPVNGPALAASGQRLALGWFSAPGGEARAQVALSPDGGATFGPAVRLDGGTPVGRVALAWPSTGEVVAAWLETVGETTELRARSVGTAGALGPVLTVSLVPGDRSSGMPRLVATDAGILAAWTTKGADDALRVETALLVNAAPSAPAR